MWDTYFFSIYSDKLMLPDDISGSIKSGVNCAASLDTYAKSINDDPME